MRDKADIMLARVLLVGTEETKGGRWNSSAAGLRGEDVGRVKGGTRSVVFFLTLVRASLEPISARLEDALTSFTTKGTLFSFSWSSVTIVMVTFLSVLVVLLIMTSWLLVILFPIVVSEIYKRSSIQ